MNQFTLSLFDSVGDTRPKEVQRTWQQLCAKFAKPAIRYEKDGLLFSPARYRFPRRLIVNVIELSLLVLEVDGAWKCEAFGMFGACDHRAPLTIFRNKKSGEDRCPKCKGKGIKISQIHFTGADLVEAVRAAFPGVAFATYSTHSHLNVTYSNPLAEPRFRIVAPLTVPVPVDRFIELWHWAVNSIQTIPMDPQVKDANRIYYTPAKFCDEAPYEWHVEPGAPLDWQTVVRPLPPPPERPLIDEGTRVWLESEFSEERNVNLPVSENRVSAEPVGSGSVAAAAPIVRNEETVSVIGPRDRREPTAINTCSHSADEWASELSPFKLGPTALYGGHVATIFENAWQFSKLYPEHADANGEPTEQYWAWARAGWQSKKPQRYPMGKGKKPLCSLWNGQRLDYVAARREIYLPLYKQLVKKTAAYRALQELFEKNSSITLFDFDGYARGQTSLRDVLNNPDRICGHAFILAMMLIYGDDFEPQDLPTTNELAGNHSATPASPAREVSSPGQADTPARGDGGATLSQRATHLSAPPATAGGTDYKTHEDRNDELGRRIIARGKRNSRGVYDARGHCHGGRGETGLLWNPDNENGAASCNAGCSYQDILRAEGLSWHNLPNREQLAVGSGQQNADSCLAAAAALPTANCQPHTSFAGPPIVSAARLHAIYSLMLAHCFDLSETDAEQAQKHWGSPYGESVQWPGTDIQALVKVCSYPTLEQQWAAAARLAQDFDLTGVPGFFYLRGALPGPHGAKLQAVNQQYTPWRINLPPMRKGGALLSPYSNDSGLIVGIRIHRNVRDVKAIWLLTSKGLPGGAHALAHQRTEEAA